MRKCLILVLCFICYQTAAAQIPNFNNYPKGDTRHQAFFNYLRPLVKQQNAKILSNRHKLQALYHSLFIQKRPLTKTQMTFVKTMFTKYRIKMQNTPTAWKKLLRRIDIIPVSLALAQAANETAYGTTRFAQKANNLFGIWCHTKGCGLVPKRRPKGASYEVQRYPSVAASVAGYMLLLNTRKSYLTLRDLRAQARQASKYPSGILLANGLLHYSQLGKVYVRAIQRLIIRHDLEKTKLSG